MNACRDEITYEQKFNEFRIIRHEVLENKPNHQYNRLIVQVMT